MFLFSGRVSLETRLGRNSQRWRYSKETLVSLHPDGQTTERMDPKGMGIFLGLSCWGKERAPARAGTCLPEVLHSSDNLHTTLQNEIEPG